MAFPKIVYNPGTGAATLEFLRPPRRVPAYSQVAARHDNLAASGVRESVVERVDNFLEFEMEWVGLGADVQAWGSFMDYALQGGPFEYYPDASIINFTSYVLEDTTWDAAYKGPGQYTFRVKFRQQAGTVAGTGLVISNPALIYPSSWAFVEGDNPGALTGSSEPGHVSFLTGGSGSVFAYCGTILHGHHGLSAPDYIGVRFVNGSFQLPAGLDISRVTKISAVIDSDHSNVSGGLDDVASCSMPYLGSLATWSGDWSRRTETVVLAPDLVAVSAFDWASFHITFLSGISLIGDADDVLDFCAKLSVVWA